MFWCNIFKSKSDIVIAACDEDILDKNLKDGRVEMKVKKEFYGGKLVDAETVAELMRRATVGNFIGKNIIELAQRDGFITKENVIFIDGIPHAQFVKI